MSTFPACYYRLSPEEHEKLVEDLRLCAGTLDVLLERALQVGSNLDCPAGLVSRRLMTLWDQLDCMKRIEEKPDRDKELSAKIKRLEKAVEELHGQLGASYKRLEEYKRAVIDKAFAEKEATGASHAWQ